MKLNDDFKTLVALQLGDEWDAFTQALEKDSPVSVRLNPHKPAPFPTSDLQQVPWCPNAYYLPQRPQFTLDPALHQGRYYVQEASSMFLWQALEQHVSPDAAVLDLCAAPGGKSTLISSYLSNEGLLVSNEPIHPRDYILLENITKWGRPNNFVCSQYPQHFGNGLTAAFDCLIVDAPCSGEGMFRKDPKAITEWSLDNVAQCVSRQRQILRDIIHCLRPGGVLIYSTCTYNARENEEQIQWLSSEFGMDYLPLQIDPAWGITETPHGYHFYPHRTRGEGLFLSVLRMPYDNKVSNIRSQEQILRCLRLSKTDENQQLVCQIGADLSVYPHFEVDRTTALQYLRTEALRLPMQEAGIPRGLVLLTYENQPLGLVKNIGTRQNNLYPKEWRIRHL